MHRLGLIIPAAGSGSRMQQTVPKPFITLDEKPILEHTLTPFLELEGLAQIVIPTSKEYIETVKSLLESIPDSINVDVIEGGSERQYSISKALDTLKSDIDLVIIHDAVRPFIKTSHIQKCINAAAEHEAAIIGVPVKDTIKKVDQDLNITDTPDRSNLWQAQTPQIFKTDLIKEAYRSALEDGYLGTDDASLVERLQKTVKVIEGDRMNFKITYPLDLQLANLLFS